MRTFYNYMVINRIAIIFTLMTLSSHALTGQTRNYPVIVDDQLILQGDKGSWDANTVHTFSIVEANKDGYRYWAYYGLDYYEKDEHNRKCGLARSNDLVKWEKYKYNPLITSNCRWPAAVFSEGIFYIFYEEYNPVHDSRIVRMESKNGIDFENKTVIVPYAPGEQNQNPFIFYDNKDSTFCLFYYNGTERAEKDKRWSIYVKKDKNLLNLAGKKPCEVVRSLTTLAAPSVAYYNNTYYLLVEELEASGDNWVTNAFWSQSADKDYERVNNNPVLHHNDACAFQYIFNNQLVVTYSHSVNFNESSWVMRMIKLK
jgi:hypothetical protein